MVKQFRVPPLFEVGQVYEAFQTKRTRRWMIKLLRDSGCIVKPTDIEASMLFVDPQVLREKIRPLYERCVEVLLEEHHKSCEKAEEIPPENSCTRPEILQKFSPDARVGAPG